MLSKCIWIHKMIQWEETASQNSPLIISSFTFWSSFFTSSRISFKHTDKQSFSFVRSIDTVVTSWTESCYFAAAVCCTYDDITPQCLQITMDWETHAESHNIIFFSRLCSFEQKQHFLHYTRDINELKVNILLWGSQNTELYCYWVAGCCCMLKSRWRNQPVWVVPYKSHFLHRLSSSSPPVS